MGFLIGLLIWFGLMAMGMGSFVSAFVDLPSLLIAGFPVLVLAPLATSWGTARSAFGYVFTSAVPADRTETERAVVFFRFLGNGALYLGILGSLIGGVIMLQNLRDLTKIGPALAIVFLTLYYGLSIRFFAYAAETRVKYKGLG